MRLLSFIFSLLISQSAFTQEDYVVRINDTTFNAALDKTYQLTINGKRVEVFLQAKDTLTYANEFYSFSYPKELKVSKVSADMNVDQIMVMNALGSGFLIQAYKTLNPSSLTELLIEQATKENTNNGYSLERTQFERIVKPGIKLRVVKLVQKYKDNVRTYEVTTYGKKDAGVAILTFNMPNNSAAAPKDVVQLLWQSLSIR